MRVDRGSIYPNLMCADLVKAAQLVLAKVREMPLDPAYTKDGNDDACAVCANLRRGGTVHSCDECSNVYHWGCIPRGAPRPRKDAEGWVCPECHAKRQRR